MPATGFMLAAGRSLGTAECKSCRRRYLFDLPVGFGILYPFCLDRDSGEASGPERGAWFRDRLIQAWKGRERDKAVALNIEVLAAKRQLVLCNCLDDVYGHVLFKLFGCARYLGQDRDVGVAVLIPENVRHLVPDGVAEVWTVSAPLKALTRWNTELHHKLSMAIAAKDRAWLGWCYPCPNPTVDISLFARSSPRPELPSGRPLVVFCSRGDRTWGRSRRAQARNLKKLSTLLRDRYAGAVLVVTGCEPSDQAVVGCLDDRNPKPDEKQERRWIDVWASADLAIGVHGSNMLLPTALAKGAIVLLPEDKYLHMLQDCLPGPGCGSPRADLCLLRTIYGDGSLANVDPRTVAGLAISMLDERDRFLALEKAAFLFADRGADQTAIIQEIQALARFRKQPGAAGVAGGQE